MHRHGQSHCLQGIGATVTAPYPGVMPSHLETGEVKAETKGLYDHGCPTTEETLTHTASPPATDHPGAAHVNNVRPKYVRGHRKYYATACAREAGCTVRWQELHTRHDERGPWTHSSGTALLRCCSGRRNFCSERSNPQRLSVDEGN